MKLLLTSNGIDQSFEQEFLEFLGPAPSEIKVAYVITAAYGEGPDISWTEIHKEQLKKYGITQIENLDIKDKTEGELREILADKNMIYVNGGNTFYLLDHARKSGFDKLVPQLLENGALYVGVSAGSILACPTIETASYSPADENKVGIEDLSALKLVPYLISPHFNENKLAEVENESKKTRYEVITLTDQQAILMEEENYRIVGGGNVTKFNEAIQDQTGE